MATLRAAARSRQVTPDVEEAAAHWRSEIERMAVTALKTTAYANGQTVLRTVKAKDIDFDQAGLEEEIADLLKKQHHTCALTGFDFSKPNDNVHLKMSLDRKNSSLGYVSGNLQVVTRAANFFKSASDDDDWALKAKALAITYLTNPC